MEMERFGGKETLKTSRCRDVEPQRNKHEGPRDAGMQRFRDPEMHMVYVGCPDVAIQSCKRCMDGGI